MFSYRKVGGLHFVKVFHLTVSYSFASKSKRAKVKASKRARSIALSAVHRELHRSHNSTMHYDHQITPAWQVFAADENPSVSSRWNF